MCVGISKENRLCIWHMDFSARLGTLTCGIQSDNYSLPARASEQGNVIGSVRIYIYCVYKK